jgi:hypothetical protein
MMPRLTDRRVRQAKELYAPDEQRQGGALVGRESGDELALDKSALEDGVLVRRAERRVGKKPLVLKAKLESGGSCLVGGAVRIRGLRALPTISLRVRVSCLSYALTSQRIAPWPAKVKNNTNKTVSLVKVYLAGTCFLAPGAARGEQRHL